MNNGMKRVVKAWAVYVVDAENKLNGDTLCHFAEFDSEGKQEQQQRYAIYKTKKDALNYLDVDRKSFDIVEVEIRIIKRRKRRP